MINPAQASREVKKELKAMFPQVKFSVTSQSYSGGSSVDIDWTGGPARDEIEVIAKKYQYGEFDGMTDSYNYTNVQKELPQAMFIFCTRR